MGVGIVTVDVGPRGVGVGVGMGVGVVTVEVGPCGVGVGVGMGLGVGVGCGCGSPALLISACSARISCCSTSKFLTAGADSRPLRNPLTTSISLLSRCCLIL